jgi:hypothetical protein
MTAGMSISPPASGPASLSRSNLPDARSPDLRGSIGTFKDSLALDWSDLALPITGEQPVEIENHFNGGWCLAKINSDPAPETLSKVRCCRRRGARPAADLLRDRPWH